jgi:hypothetical protein
MVARSAFDGFEMPMRSMTLPVGTGASRDRERGENPFPQLKHWHHASGNIIPVGTLSTALPRLRLRSGLLRQAELPQVVLRLGAHVYVMALFFHKNPLALVSERLLAEGELGPPLLVISVGAAGAYFFNLIPGPPPTLMNSTPGPLECVAAPLDRQAFSMRLS